MTDSENDDYDHLTRLAIGEFAAATGGCQLSAADARSLCRTLLAGRAVSSRAAYLVAAIRAAPDPFALLGAANTPAAPRSRSRPSDRTVAEAIPRYAERRAAVLACYAEAARRKAAGEPMQWRDREARLRAAAARRLAEDRALFAAMDPAGRAARFSDDPDHDWDPDHDELGDDPIRDPGEDDYDPDEEWPVIPDDQPHPDPDPENDNDQYPF